MPLARLRRGRRALTIAVVAGAVVAVDQLTKTWALSALAGGPRHVLWTLQLNLSFNSGAAFGLGRGMAPLLLAAGVGVLLFLARYSRHLTGTLPTVALALVVGGAAGNLVDRLVRGHGGSVIDFIDFQWWPIFNVADMAIVVGASLLVLTAGRE
jgi:signal peptidase II